MSRTLCTLVSFWMVACAATEPPHTEPVGSPPAPAPMTAPAPTTAPAPMPVQAPPPPPPSSPPPAPQLPEPSYPVGAIGPSCILRAEIEPIVRADSIAMRFVLVNNSHAPATITLTGTCPGGLVELHGLPAGFDPMHRCQAGACVNPESKATYKIPARGKVTLGETTLRAKGDACNPPLPMGSTFLQATIVSDNPLDACNGATVHLVRDPRTGTLRRAADAEAPVPAVLVKPAPTPKTKPAPTPAPAPKPAPVAPRKNCPTCAFACPRGVPSRKVGPDGCPSCSCENFDIHAPPQAPPKPPATP